MIKQKLRIVGSDVNRPPDFFLDSRENFPHSPLFYLLRQFEKTKMIKN
jgi:hypothetical protein